MKRSWFDVLRSQAEGEEDADRRPAPHAPGVPPAAAAAAQPRQLCGLCGQALCEDDVAERIATCEGGEEGGSSPAPGVWVHPECNSRRAQQAGQKAAAHEQAPPDLMAETLAAEDRAGAGVEEEDAAESGPELKWTEEQQKALDFATKKDVSFYLCGRAGTGKTALINAIVERLHNQGKIVAVTAMTGAAACLLASGQTMHSWAGIGLAKEDAHILASKVSGKARKRWAATDLLIVDECSMLSSELLEKLHYVAKRVRDSDDFFGGLNLLLVGDLHQLSPVEGKMLYHSPTFNYVAMNSVLLTRIFRQSDPLTLKVLEEVRVGRLSEEATRHLSSLSTTPLDEERKTVLTSLRRVEEALNTTKLASLQTKLRAYKAADEGERGRECSLGDQVGLKVGARVMCLKNNGKQGSDRLVNGSTGIVLKFVKMRYGADAYREAFKWDESGLLVNRYNTEYVPLVRWDSGSESLVRRMEEQKENEKGKVVFTRQQVPLRLAWAITIHKAQGMTLQQVEIDLGGCFAKGQAYVALSRCQDLSGVKLLNFAPRAVMTDSNVVNLYRRMQGLPPLTPVPVRSAAPAGNRPVPFRPTGPVPFVPGAAAAPLRPVPFVNPTAPVRPVPFVNPSSAPAVAPATAPRCVGGSAGRPAEAAQGVLPPAPLPQTQPGPANPLQTLADFVKR